MLFVNSALFPERLSILAKDIDMLLSREQDLGHSVKRQRDSIALTATEQAFQMRNARLNSTGNRVPRHSRTAMTDYQGFWHDSLRCNL